MILGLINVNFTITKIQFWLIDVVDTNKILISNKVSFGKNGYKYFVGYKDDYHQIIPLCVMLQKMRCVLNTFHSVSFRVFSGGIKWQLFTQNELIQVSVDFVFAHNLLLVWPLTIQRITKN